MPKIKDFLPEAKVVATLINPAYGVGMAIVEKLFIKPKKKAEIMLEGKKTYIGILIAVMPAVAGWFGYEVSATFSEDASVVLNELVTVAGAMIAFWGRAVTKTTNMFIK